MGLLTKIWNGIKNVLGFILPLGQAKTYQGLGPAIRWTVHVLLLVAILVGLYFLNKPIEYLVPTPVRVFSQFWLPILFLLMYVLAWAAWWLYKLLATPEQASVFPDIDEAWAEGVKALGQ